MLFKVREIVGVTLIGVLSTPSVHTLKVKSKSLTLDKVKFYILCILNVIHTICPHFQVSIFKVKSKSFGFMV